ncbi:MAG: molybdopterin-dependent oxidoreductase [Actinobacteria bacterium]|nr:molybdopterin-dependent oxidoreductase [Actinomycetota bacterium]
MNKKLRSTERNNIITTTCSYDCGGRCLLEVHVRDNKVIKIRSKNAEGLNISACPRGLTQKNVLYSPDRLKTPLKRIGEKGSNDFRAISWDEALDTVADKLKQVIKEYGTGSIYFIPGSGSLATLNNLGKVSARFFGMLGKCTTVWGNESFEAASQSSLATFGTENTGNSRDNIMYSKLIILWGWNPNVSRFGSDTAHYLRKAKKSGVRVLSVDPRNSQTGQSLADEWIPIRPGTDAAMLIAMAYVMIKEELYDKDFIQKYTYGFSHYHDYIMGAVDGIEKSPQWAESICGVPSGTIKNIAREYAKHKPSALMTGWAPGRSAYGEQFHRAASILAAMTGNIGNIGGFVSGGTNVISLGRLDKKIPVPEVEHNQIHNTDLYESLLEGTVKGSPAECKLLYFIGANFLNQHLNLNKGKQALTKQDFIVVHDLFLTPTARFADIVLPVTHYLEQDDVGFPWGGGGYGIFMNKAVEPIPGPKSDLRIFTELAKRIGTIKFNDKTDMEWIDTILKNKPDFPDLKTLKDKDIYRFKTEGPLVAFSQQIKDPVNNPFPTPSGKIEIFSKRFDDMKNPLIPPIPKYIAPWEGPDDQVAEDYPIQLISPHSRARINSQLDNIEEVKKLKDDDLWMNPKDAHKRSIKDRDMVYVFNKRGRIYTRVKVTEAIMPGVASLDQGQWYEPNSQGIDLGGCVNVLTLDKKSPTGALSSNTCLVQIEKA